MSNGIEFNIRLTARKSEMSDGLTSYLVSSFSESNLAKFEYAKSSVQNLHESRKLGSGPIALFTALTAEEEAATFLYHALVHRGYALPDLKRLRAHQDKIRVTFWAKALITFYQFGK